jgi:hypothetical protein
MTRNLLLKMGDEDHILALITHHIASDGWSSGILLRELTALYEAALLAKPAPLPELPIQYADYAVWQRQWLSGSLMEQELAYWKDHLSGAPGLLDLPADHVRPTAMNHTGATHLFVFPEDLSQSLRKIGQHESATLFMTLMAGYAALLGRLAGQDDISIGTPIANRTRAEVEGLIGFFVNTLVIRTNLEGAPSFREMIKRVREASLGAYAHQDAPFEMVVEAVQPQRSLSHTPLFQAMFTLQSEGINPMELSGLRMEEQKMGAQTGLAKFDLTLTVSEGAGGLIGQLDYSTELFEARTMERMARQLEMLLKGAVADPDRSVNEIEILSPAEREELLVGWNRTGVEYPEHSSVQEMFE